MNKTVFFLISLFISMTVYAQNGDGDSDINNRIKDLEKISEMGGVDISAETENLQNLNDLKKVNNNQKVEELKKLDGKIHDTTALEVHTNEDYYNIDWSGQSKYNQIFSGVDFYDANLSHVDFSYTTFINTDFRKVILDGACFYGATFKNSDIDFSSSLTNANLTNAKLSNSDIAGKQDQVIWKGAPCGEGKDVANFVH